MSDNKQESRQIKKQSLNRHRLGRRSSRTKSYDECNVNKPTVRVNYSPARTRQNSHYANGRLDKKLAEIETQVETNQS
jgi:hypothetical protein